jgi:hypothetical protein
MKPLKVFLSNINILNLLLFGACLFLFVTLDYPLLNKKIEVAIPKSKEAPGQSQEIVAAVSSIAYSDFIAVAEKNLFHPERKVPQVIKDAQAAVPKPDLILYGTLITDNLSIAYIEDKKAPYATPGRANRQTQLKKGDSIAGFVLREVEPARIILTKGEEKLVVMLDSKDKRRGPEMSGPMAAKPQAGNLPMAPGAPGAAAAAFLPPARTAEQAIPLSSRNPRQSQLEAVRDAKQDMRLQRRDSVKQ